MNFISNYNKQKSVYSRFRPSFYDNKIHDIGQYQEPSTHYPSQLHYLIIEPIHITAPILLFDEDRIDEKISPRKAHVTPRMYQTVTFNQTKNKTVYINGKDFYKNNNIKNNIWWSPQELAFIRNMFTIEVQRECIKNPNKSYRDCVLDLINRDA